MCRNATQYKICVGVTLIELVVVLMILAILAAVAAPRFADSLSRYRAESAAKRIVHDLRLARRHAQTVSGSQSVVFNSPSPHQYELTGMMDPHRGGETYVVSVFAEPYLATIVAADLGGDDTIIFDGYGTPDTGGTITVQAGAHQEIVQVDAATGKAEVQ
jgi:prepilin-type N-terminal cleavage/methylation domain-containing protein